MPLFQQSVLKKYLSDLDKVKVAAAWLLFKSHFLHPDIQQNIRAAKEEQYQEGFLRELFVQVLGYTLNPQPDYNLTSEHKNEKDSKKADGAILLNKAVRGVIELKGTETTDLSKIEKQAFSYLHNHKGCTYVITSNFEKLRFYIGDATDWQEFNLFQMTEEEFALLYLCLHKDNLLTDVPLTIKQQSLAQEDAITKKLYADYSKFKMALFEDMAECNKQYDRLELFRKTQKLLDRFLFILFAEDRLLLPPNFIVKIVEDWKQLQKLRIQQSLYERFKLYFNDLLKGNSQEDIFAYNGGLFEPDDVLDNLQINDTILMDGVLTLSRYDYNTEVDVNILGHIFEHSLNEIEELQANIEGKALEKGKTRRKKDGVFYTPRFITKYMVENTIGTLSREKKEALGIVEEYYIGGKSKSAKKTLIEKLDTYRSWLLQLTICDPACGSGAFLNAALEFLIAEHEYVDELTAKVLGHSLVYSDITKDILENNLYGVDINEEAVEIARLSLWLRTAQKGRKLSNLSRNIKCGNSLIDDVSVAGEKAFKWQKEFKSVFDKGGFDVVIGNPPYGAIFSNNEIKFYRNNYSIVVGHSEAYYIFYQISYEILKHNSKLAFITPNAWFSNKYAHGVRQLLLKNFEIDVLVNFNKKIVFEDANVEAAIVICTKTNSPKKQFCFVGSDTDKTFKYNYITWLKSKNHIISFNDNDLVNTILEKINLLENTLEDVLDISNGFKPYQVGYGRNLDGLPLTKEDVDAKIYHSCTAQNENFKKELKGKGVNRYKLVWEESYINWGSWLMSPKDVKYFENPKLLIRQIISDYIITTFDNDKYYADQTLYVAINYTGVEKSNLLYFLAILNSKLYGFYFRKFYSEEDDLFPKIKVNELKSLPVIKPTEESQIPFIEKAEIMLLKNKEKFQITIGFLRFLKAKYDTLSTSKKLNDWPSLSFKEFLKELEKQNVKLSFSEQSEWMQYFEAEKSKANDIQQIIDKTDKEIDALVYQLYGLTEEEITIVENS